MLSRVKLNLTSNSFSN